MAATEFNVETRWPELFVQLGAADREAVIHALAASWYAGWVPNREDVENLTDYARGVIDKAEYDRRVAGAVERDNPLAAAG